MDTDESVWVKDIKGQMSKLRDKGEYAAARKLREDALAARTGLSEAAREAVDVAGALATYQDPELPMRSRLKQAQELLQAHLRRSVDPETLGVAGAIERRFYDLDTRVEHLERALAFYARGHERDEAAHWPSYGYPGINAAHLNDMIANIEAASGLAIPLHAAIDRRATAKRIREQLLAKVPPPDADQEKQYWYRATMAEAALGLEDFDRAKREISAAVLLAPAPWMIRSTALQLAARLRQQRPDRQVSPQGRDVLHALVGDSVDAVCSAIRGRLGLALSGGGFRASFFHIGVLARLAELDLLRHVEVLSCVSGGSLLGALYALELKHLHESKVDTEIARQDYTDLVQRVAARFFEEVRKNIRVRVAFSVAQNWLMLSGDKSRSHRAAELYEECLYARVGAGDVPRRQGDRYVTELAITPAGTNGFKQDSDNWRRKNKVPRVVFNAATLNTGHAWHFTPDAMGEPPAREEDVDVNDRFVRLRYGDFPRQPRGPYDVRLGAAVAASACVPGLFEPLAIERAYVGPRPLLVDGGVHDNQGTSALLERDCTAVIVSDASGQMGMDGDPSASALGSLLRSNSVFQARIREAQYQDLVAREQGRLISAQTFLHLKQGFAAREIRPGAADVVGEEKPLPYEISRDVQQRLAGLRTDLDAFSTLEAEALMSSGYLIAQQAVDPQRYEAPPPPRDAFSEAPLEESFPFLRVKPLLASAPGKTPTEERVLQLLSAGEQVAGKVFAVNKTAAILGKVGVAVAALAVIGLMWAFRDRALTHITVGGAAVMLAAAGLRAWRPEIGTAFDFLKPFDVITGYIKTAALSVAGSLIARAHVRWADRAFLAAGDVPSLLASLARDREEARQPAPAAPRAEAAE